ncbi:MAG: extracellular solute-binding protein [Oscillospiraceae bacterium]|jgi:multiple sugar transport system substrate-binding protein/putative aldouronate transport system substrate-binding protein|nr:extracellular solute-binding protein [Oscillospiraceae bacterium]
MSKRFITLLLALAMLIGLALPALAEDEAAAREARAFAKFPEPVEVHIGMSIDPTDATLLSGDTAEDNVYTRYLLENFNIKVVVDWTAASGDDYNQKLALSIAGNSLPDGIIAPDRTYFMAAAKADMLYDLTDLFAEYASQALLDTHASTGGRAVQISSIDGRLKAMPNTSVATDGINVMFIRQDWLDKLGLSVPKTVSEIGDVARAFKEANFGANGVTIPILGAQNDSRVYQYFLESANISGVFDPIFQAFDAYPGYWIDNAGTVEYGTLSPNTKAALEVLSQWYAEGLIDPEFATRKYLAEPINAGQVGIFFGPWWAMGYGYADIWKNVPDADWQAYPVYTDDGQWNTHMKEVGTQYSLVNKNVSEDVAKAIVIMANVYKRDEAKLTNETTEAIAWYPLRNVMAPADECEYEYEELWKVIKGETTAEDYNIPGSMYPNMYADAVGVTDAVSWNGEEQLHISNFDINHVNFNRMYAILIGDRPVATGAPDKEVYSVTYSNTDKMARYWSNLWALEEETIRQIITGKQPLDAFDSFVQQWKDEGGDAMLEEVQSLK